MLNQFNNEFIKLSDDEIKNIILFRDDEEFHKFISSKL